MDAEMGEGQPSDETSAPKSSSDVDMSSAITKAKDWSPEATDVLVTAWVDVNKAGEMKNLNNTQWQAIVDKVNSRCAGEKPPKTLKQCKGKLDMLKVKYKSMKKEKSSLGGIGEQKTLKWKWFDALDPILSRGAYRSPGTPGDESALGNLSAPDSDLIKRERLIEDLNGEAAAGSLGEAAKDENKQKAVDTSVESGPLAENLVDVLEGNLGGNLLEVLTGKPQLEIAGNPSSGNVGGASTPNSSSLGAKQDSKNPRTLPAGVSNTQILNAANTALKYPDLLTGLLSLPGIGALPGMVGNANNTNSNVSERFRNVPSTSGTGGAGGGGGTQERALTLTLEKFIECYVRSAELDRKAMESVSRDNRIFLLELEKERLKSKRDLKLESQRMKLEMDFKIEFERMKAAQELDKAKAEVRRLELTLELEREKQRTGKSPAGET